MKTTITFLIWAGTILLAGAQGTAVVTYKPYLGISAEYVLITGSFNGDAFFFVDDEIMLVPRLNPGAGFGINGGIRFQKLALDFAYKRSTHNCSLMEGKSGIAAFNVIRFIGIKSYIGKPRIVQPFIDMDLSGSWMRVSNASYIETSPQIVDKATFGAIIFGIGGGLAVTAKTIGFELKALPALYMGTDVKGIQKTNYEITKFNSFKFDTSATLIYYFRGK